MFNKNTEDMKEAVSSRLNNTNDYIKENNLLYKMTIGIFLKQVFKRRYLKTHTRFKDDMKREEDVNYQSSTKLSLLQTINSLFLIDILFFIIIAQNNVFYALISLVVINLINTFLYTMCDFTTYEYIDIAKNLLEERGDSIKFKEKFIYHDTSYRLLEYAYVLNEFLKDSSSQSRNTSLDSKNTDYLSKNFELIDTEFMKDSNYKRFIQQIENEIGTKSIIRVKIKDVFKNNKTRSLNDEYVRMMYVIPQIQYDKAVYSEQGVFMFDATSVITREDRETDQYFEMLRMLYAPYFIEFKEDMKREEEHRLKREELERKEAELKEIKDYVSKYNLPNEAESILRKINQNKEKWQFYYWNQNADSINGNKDYLRIKCKMLNNQNITKINNLKSEIESVLGKKVVIEEVLNDANSFNLLVLFKQTIAQYKMTASQLLNYTSQNKLFIGRGQTGDITVDFDDNAYHSLTGGGSGSGKSVDLQCDIFQMLTLKDFKYQHAVVISGGKLADFQNLGLSKLNTLMLNAGENLDSNGRTVLTEEQSIAKIYDYIKMLEWELNRRENMFLNEGVANITEYNEKHPTKKIGRILFVADEWESLRRIAKRYKNEEYNKNYDDLILASVSNLFSKGRSGGLNIKVATQDFTADTVGTVRRQFTALKLGVGDANTYKSYNGSEVAKYFSEMTRSGQKTEGTFFLQSSKMKFNTQPIEFSNNFSMLRTPFVEASDLRKSILSNVETFETHELYEEFKKVTETTEVEDTKKGSKAKETKDMKDLMMEDLIQ